MNIISSSLLGGHWDPKSLLPVPRHQQAILWSMENWLVFLPSKPNGRIRVKPMSLPATQKHCQIIIIFISAKFTGKISSKFNRMKPSICFSNLWLSPIGYNGSTVSGRMRVCVWSIFILWKFVFFSAAAGCVQSPREMRVIGFGCPGRTPHEARTVPSTTCS